MKKLIITSMLVLALSGCAATDYQNEHFKTSPEVTVTTKHGDFVVQDNKAERRLLVHRDLGHDIMLGITPLVYNKEAAEKYLAKKGCRIIDGSQIAGSFYEFSYTCGATTP